MSAGRSAILVEAGRHEFKYRVSRLQYPALKNGIRTHMRPDIYTTRAGRDGYFVRSLYFETADERIYSEKLAGDCARVKYRLRTYCPELETAPPVRVELKVRRGESLSKHQAVVKLEEYDHFMKRRRWTTPDDPVLEEFARGMHLAGLHPYVLIDYSREGFESRHGDGVRLTLDHRVRSAQADTLFPPVPPFFRVHHSSEVVVETKFRGPAPAWLRELVKRYGLRQVANSKFSQGIEAGRRDRCPPDGVVVIR